MARLQVNVQRVPGLGYFARITVMGYVFAPLNEEHGPSSSATYLADSIEAINIEVAKVKRAGHECDVVHAL